MRSNPKLKSSSSNQPKVNKDPSPVNLIIGKYSGLYFDKFGVKPAINGAWCGKMIKELLVDHSPEGLLRIIDLYFEDRANEGRVYHLPNMLSAWSLNKYLPMIRFDPQIYDNAEELNKYIY